MSRFTAAQMMQGRKKGTKPAPAPAAKVTVKVPPGGRANIRKIDNGVIVETVDKNWNQVSEQFAPDASSVSLGD